MHWLSSLVLAFLVGLSAAHADPNSPEYGQHAPKIFGGRTFLSELKGRRASPGRVSKVHMHQVTEEQPNVNVEERDDSGTQDPSANTSGRCGGTRGSCAAGYCCSAEG
jgi:hypothetical protein